MGPRQLKDCALLASIVAITRLVFSSRYLYDLDSVNFALAVEKFDPALLQPHPPGYYLYVVAGRLLRAIFEDPNTAFVTISIVASCGMAVSVYWLASTWFGSRAARCAGLLFVLSPLCWFHGTVALTYIVEGFFAALLGYLCWQTYIGRDRFLIASAIVLGLAVGFRQSSILFLGPLVLLSWRRAGWRHISLGAAAFGLTSLCWFAPMVAESGGLSRYFTALHTMWSAIPAQKTVFSYPLWEALGLAMSRAATILFAAVLCFGPFVCMPLLHRSKTTSAEFRTYVGLWLFPGLVFFCLIYLLFVNSGYLLILCPPVFAWLGFRTAEWLDSPSPGWSRTGTVAACATLNVVLFLWGPWYCSFRSVRAFESDLEAMQKAVRGQFSPRDTVLVSFDSHFMGFRHVGYYLPEFLTVVYPEAQFPDGKATFSMQNGQTQILAEPPDTKKNFAMTPLPQGERYDRYQQNVVARFPDGSLRTITSGRMHFQVGSLTDLHYALPNAFPHRSALYTSVDTSR